MQWLIDLVKKRYQNKSGYAIVADEAGQCYKGEEVKNFFYYDADIDGFSGLTSPFEHPLLDGLIIYKDAKEAMDVLDECYSSDIEDRLSTHIVRVSDLADILKRLADETSKIDLETEDAEKKAYVVIKLIHNRELQTIGGSVANDFYFFTRKFESIYDATESDGYLASEHPGLDDGAGIVFKSIATYSTAEEAFKVIHKADDDSISEYNASYKAHIHDYSEFSTNYQVTTLYHCRLLAEDIQREKEMAREAREEAKGGK